MIDYFLSEQNSHRLKSKELVEKEELFRIAFDFSGIGMAILSMEGQWIHVNTSLCKILGYTETELQKTTFQALTHPNDLISNSNTLNKLIAGEIPSMQIVKRYRHAQGHYIWGRLTTSIARTEFGQPQYYVSQIEDLSGEIAERAKYEIMLAQRESEITSSEKQLALLSFSLDHAKEATFLIDEHSSFIYVNGQACNSLGYTQAELLSKKVTDIVDDFPFNDYQAQLREHKTTDLTIEAKHKTKSGSMFPVEININYFEYEGVTYFLAMSQDITRRKQAEMEIMQTTRSLRMLSDVNQALIHIADEASLLNEVCKIVVEIGGYRMAWIGFEVDDNTKTIIPVAHAGFVMDYMESANVSSTNNKNKQDIFEIAMFTGKLNIVHNILQETILPSWQKKTSSNYYTSIIAIPIKIKEQTIGVLGVYSDKVRAFDTKEVEILKEMTDDLAFGITSLRIKEKKRKVEESLRASEERFSAIFRFSPLGIAIFRANDDRIIDVNDVFISSSGYSRNEIIGYTTAELGFYKNISDREKIQTLFKQQGFVESYEFEVQNKTGETKTVICAITSVNINEEKHYQALILDITERKLAEKILLDSENKYRVVADNTYNWEFWSNPEGKYIYCSPSCLRVSGYSATEFIENPELKFEIVHPDYHSAFYEHTRHNSTDTAPLSLQYKIIHKDGTERWIEHISQSVFDNNGNYLGRRGSNCDITEKKETDRKILDAIITTEEMERNKFSQELHDGLGPILSTVKLYFEWLSETSMAKEHKNITEIGLQNINEAILAVREISNSLSPMVLNNFGLVSALKHLTNRINKTGKLSINFIYDSEKRYNTQIEVTLYRVVSELVNNTMKYADAHFITINMNHNIDKNSILITYFDDGKGFDLNKVMENKKGMGLYNIMQRVATLNGTIHFETNEGQSLYVEIELPQINE